MKWKSGILAVTLLVFLSFNNNVFAKENYYINDFGVFFNQEEYDFLSMMFWDGCQDLINESDYQKFISSNIMNGKITINESEENISTYGTTIGTNEKNLKIVSSCTSDCLISVTATWLKLPAVKSYDVIGARFEKTSLKELLRTSVKSSTGTTYSTETKKFNNGFGVSIVLPKYGNSIIVSQTYRVNKGGTIYASYQHALKSISLDNSKNYSIDSSGYGKVFKFSGVASSTYDKMSCVDITV